jgi:hypothetical protein
LSETVSRVPVFVVAGLALFHRGSQLIPRLLKLCAFLLGGQRLHHAL